jgi:hypothetical protein
MSRTGTCMGRVGTVDDLSEGGFRMHFPLSSGTTGVEEEQMLRNVENSDTFYFILYAKKHIE